MRPLRMLALTIALASLGFAPGAAAKNQHTTFQLVMEQPNVARASSGDTLAVTGDGTFAVHPKSVTASGGFVHTLAGGSASGTWTATDLLSFHFYGCGVIPSIGLTLPSDLCGGALKLRVVLTPAGTTQTIPGIMSVFCVIGPKAPSTHDNPTQAGEEGVTAVVPGVANFNKIVSGMNVYVRTS